MNRPTKFGFAVLVALVLLCTPVGFCAAVAQPAGPPSHPCCPAKPDSVPPDCGRPGCVYMDTSVVPDSPPDVAVVAIVPLLIPALPVPVELAPAPFAVGPPVQPSPPSFVANHQFRI